MTPPWTARSTAPYIIAEIGVNHDGSVARAIELVDAAACADADAIKLQLFQTDLLMSSAAKLASYQRSAGEVDPVAMLRRLELSAHDLAPVVNRAIALGLDSIVTVFSVDLIAEAQELPWAAYKTASPDIINQPLIQSLAQLGAPLILSTGASTLDEVKRAVHWLSPYQNQLAILQCVSAYPAPMDRAALGGIVALSRTFDWPVGYSDHTGAIETGALAAAQGAVIIEKHLTYDRAAGGPDHRASLDPTMFASYVAMARRAACVPAEVSITDTSADTSTPSVLPAAPSVGPIEKVVLDIEHDVRNVSRQSIVARRDIAAGETLTHDMLTIKRPGVGLEPFRLQEIVGAVASRPIAGDLPIVQDDLV